MTTWSRILLPARLVSTVNRRAFSTSLLVLSWRRGCDYLQRPNRNRWREAVPPSWVVLQVPLNREVFLYLLQVPHCCPKLKFLNFISGNWMSYVVGLLWGCCWWTLTLLTANYDPAKGLKFFLFLCGNSALFPSSLHLIGAIPLCGSKYIILNSVRQHNHFSAQGNYKATCFDYRLVILRPIFSIMSQDAMYNLGSGRVYIHGIHQIKSFVSKGVTCKLCLRDFVLKWSEVKWCEGKWREVSYVEVLGDKSTMHTRVTLYWGYWIVRVLWLFHLVCVLCCGCFNLFWNVWACVGAGFVMCGYVYVWVL